MRRAGGFAKDTTPFSEFLWADFLRRRMKRKTVESDFERAIEKAMNWPRAQDASLFAGMVRPAGGGLIGTMPAAACARPAYWSSRRAAALL